MTVRPTLGCGFQLEGDLFFAPGFPSPPNSDYKGYHQYIDEVLPPESPYLYGLHPNAEIGTAGRLGGAVRTGYGGLSPLTVCYLGRQGADILSSVALGRRADAQCERSKRE